MYSALITSLSNLFARLFEWKTTKTQHQSETEIIKDKKDYKKATNIAEKIIDIAQQYKADMTFAHRLSALYRRLKNTTSRKHNG